jgi:hypothetical protein
MACQLMEMEFLLFLNNLQDKSLITFMRQEGLSMTLSKKYLQTSFTPSSMLYAQVMKLLLDQCQRRGLLINSLPTFLEFRNQASSSREAVGLLKPSRTKLIMGS